MLFILTFEFSPTPLKVLSDSFISRVLFVAADLSAHYDLQTGAPLCSSQWSSQLILSVQLGFISLNLWNSIVLPQLSKGRLSLCLSFILFLWQGLQESILALNFCSSYLDFPNPGLTGMDHCTLYVANISFSSDHTNFPVSVDWEFR